MKTKTWMRVIVVRASCSLCSLTSVVEASCFVESSMAMATHPAYGPCVRLASVFACVRKSVLSRSCSYDEYMWVGAMTFGGIVLWK